VTFPEYAVLSSTSIGGCRARGVVHKNLRILRRNERERDYDRERRDVMTDSPRTSRRDFFRTASAGALASTLAPSILRAAATPASPNDRIQLATIGLGFQGLIDTNTALKVPGVELVAVADCYDGRLQRAKELFGDQLHTTRDCWEVFGRDDVDVVIIATPDHWHQKLAIAALKAGKGVYLEKPMVQKIEEGAALVATQKQTGKVLQVGSQPMSSVVTEKARELYRDGAIGKLNMVSILISRNDAMGAWEWPIPTDASPETIAWDRFLGDAPKRPFDAERFFRWRKYWDYGTGVAGDMYVHRFTSLHRIIDSKGPVKGMATGGVRFWMDREVPDLQLGLYEYPETDTHPAFTLQLGANFADGGHGPVFQLIGDEGMMSVRDSRVVLSRRPREDEEGFGQSILRTFAEAEQERWIEAHEKKSAQMVPQTAELSGTSEFRAPEGYSSHLDHFLIFFRAVRGGEPVVEDATYGFRAAAPALIANLAYLENRIVGWDPESMTLKD
jgi:predicted dehydrogenase